MPTDPKPKSSSNDVAAVYGIAMLIIFGGCFLMVAVFSVGEARGRNDRAREITEAAGVCDDMNAMGFGDLPGPGGFYTDANCRTIRNLAMEKKFYDDGKAD